MMLLDHARLLDLHSGAVHTDQAVLIDGARIAAVGPRAQIPRPESASVHDLAGKLLLPGFIDCHAHLGAIEYELEKRLTTPGSLSVLRSARNLHETLQAGVTSVREAGGLDVGMRMAVDEGLIPGPRMQMSVVIIGQTGTIWHLPMAAGAKLDMNGMWGQVVHYCDGVDALRKLARELLASGADLLNIHTTSSIHKRPQEMPTAMYTLAEIEAVVEEAHRAGKRVMAHVDGGPGVANAIRGGVDSVDHPYYLSDADIELLLRHDTWLVPTLSCNHGILRIAERDPHAGIHETALEGARRIIAIHNEGFGRAVKAGVKIAMGSDSYGSFQADNLFELELMVQGGMSPLQALRSATCDAARLMGWEDRLGRIEAGLYADLVAVDGDPLADIRILQHRERLSLIIKNGAVVANRLPAAA
jgi:imidazolonepropionase-like amidohydrolase